MSKTLVDTDILSLLMRQHSGVVFSATEYLQSYSQLSFSIVTRYEILRGLKLKNAQKQLSAFNVFCQASEIITISEQTINIASSIYANLRQGGEIIGDADILIAATALEHNLILATNNERHFARISNLIIDNWSKT